MFGSEPHHLRNKPRHLKIRRLAAQEGLREIASTQTGRGDVPTHVARDVVCEVHAVELCVLYVQRSATRRNSLPVASERLGTIDA